VRDQGLLRRAAWFYGILGGVLALSLAGLTAAFIALGDSWFQLFVAAGLGIVLTQIAFIAHEASHRQVLASGPINDRLGRWLATFGVGMSYQWWMTKHTRHHANPNRLDRDPDVASDIIIFTQEAAAAREGLAATLTRNQGWLFYPLIAFEGFNLHVQSVRSLVRRGDVKGRRFELTAIAAHFGLYFAVLLIALPFPQAVAFFVVQTLVFGFYLGTSFAVNHIGMTMIPNHVELDFFRRQVLTSRNISGGFWATALLGGLNYQVEHHLFPSMARPYLARTRELVRERCAELAIPYTEMTLGAAHRQVARHIQAVGIAARDPFACGFRSLYRRN
jgi:fatty acid desaturase